MMEDAAIQRRLGVNPVIRCCADTSVATRAKRLPSRQYFHHGGVAMLTYVTYKHDYWRGLVALAGGPRVGHGD
jgi:hypothetical protein